MKPIELFSGKAPTATLFGHKAKAVTFGNGLQPPAAPAMPGLDAAPAAAPSPAPVAAPGTLALRFGVSFADKAPVMSLDDLKSDYDLTPARTTAPEMSFDEYLNLVSQNPLPLRTAHQRVYDMIRSKEGTNEEGQYNEPETVERFGKPVRKWQFFTNPVNPGDALLGVEEPIDQIVQHITQAAKGTDAKKRMLLLVGGPGSAKSTLVRALKTGYEQYCASEEGTQYTTKFVGIPQEVQDKFKNVVEDEFVDQVRFNPVYLLPKATRKKFEEKLNGANFGELGYRLNITQGEVPPASQLVFDALVEYEAKATGGDQKAAREAALNKYVRVTQVDVSKIGRTGIATFEAGDPKSIDQTMMTGNPNMIKALKTSEHNPLAFDFGSGEFFAANGGILEFIEALKLPKELLLKLLSLNEERVAKGDKMPDVFVDEFVVAHTNLPEFEDKNNDAEMAATMKRMKIVKMPYNTEISREEEIHKRIIQQFADDEGIHIAPHTFRTTAVWAVLSRLVPGTGVTPLDKARLYNGERTSNKDISDTEIRRLIDDGVGAQEGLTGVSPRELQQVLPAILTHPELTEEKSIDGYALIKLLQEKMNSGEIKVEGDAKQIGAQIVQATADLDKHVMRDVLSAVAGDKDTLQNYLSNYLTNVEAFCDGKSVRTRYGIGENPELGSKMMEEIERNMGVFPSTAKEHRRKLMATIGVLRANGKDNITPDDVPELKDALINFGVSRVKDTVPVEVLLTTKTLTPKEEQVRSQILENLKGFGYNDVTASNALARFSQLKEKGSGRL